MIHINYSTNNIETGCLLGEWIDEFDKDNYNNDWSKEATNESVSAMFRGTVIADRLCNDSCSSSIKRIQTIPSLKRGKERDLLRLLLHDKGIAGMHRERMKVSRYETTFSRGQRWKRQRIPNSDRPIGRQ
ncbi:hypothetical protein V1477_006227 [Vespula maculifrons]|uniref:Uncharacterized protein n=1 Tax=Vespula maculifrons TaxID=7453 RepID=A0ABD2CJV3_VESMC